MNNIFKETKSVAVYVLQLIQKKRAPIFRKKNRIFVISKDIRIDRLISVAA